MTLRSLRPSCGLICLMNERVVLVVCAAVSLCASRLHKWVTKSSRQMVHLGAERLHVSARMRLESRRGFSWHSSCTTYCFALPPLIMRVEGQKQRWRILRLRVCMCLHLCVCIARGRRLREEEEEGGGVVGNRSILQMLRGGVNGKFCGYQSRGALWLGEVCHMRPHPGSVSLFVWRGDRRKSSGEEGDWEVTWKDQEEGRGRKREEEKIEKHVYLWRLGLTS